MTRRVALVTGGSRGIGAAIALRLAAEGADVVITYTRSAERAAAVVKEIEAVGARGLAVAMEAANAGTLVSAVERTVAEFGRIDILVSNAGVAPFGPLEEVTLARGRQHPRDPLPRRRSCWLRRPPGTWAGEAGSSPSAAVSPNACRTRDGPSTR